MTESVAPAPAELPQAPEPRTATTTTTGTELFDGERGVVAIRVDGVLKDLAADVQAGETAEAVTLQEQDGLDILRHSAAHVLAQAVQQINPDAKLGIGPPVTDGFYYDFDVAEPFTPEDLKAIEKGMDRIVKQAQRFRRVVVTDEQARELMAGSRTSRSSSG